MKSRKAEETNGEATSYSLLRSAEDRVDLTSGLVGCGMEQKRRSREEREKKERRERMKGKISERSDGRRLEGGGEEMLSSRWREIGDHRSHPERKREKNTRTGRRRKRYVQGREKERKKDRREGRRRSAW